MMDMRPTLILSYLGLSVLFALSFGCGGPSPSQGDGTQVSSDSAGGATPELTDQVIDERINDARVRDVPPESGTGEPIGWSFDEDEPKEIKVVDKKIDGGKATVVLDITTRSSPRAREPRQLVGQIRTEWALKTGWVLRRWEIVDVENISMKFKNLPKPETPQIPNDNRQANSANSTPPPAP